MATRRVTVAAVVTLAVVAAARMGLAMEEETQQQDERNLTRVIEENLDELVDVIEEGLSLDEGNQSDLESSFSSSLGNILYSTAGFLLGGLMLFVSIFDATRKPVIELFENIFGGRQARRRREVSAGLDARVAAAFHAFTSAVDKMDVILSMASDRK